MIKYKKVTMNSSHPTTKTQIHFNPSSLDLSDKLLAQAIELAVQNRVISTSTLQRKLKIAYARAGRIIDELEKQGIISPKNNSTYQHTCLISPDEWKKISSVISSKKNIQPSEQETAWTSMPYVFPPITDLTKPIQDQDKPEEIAKTIEVLFARNGIAVRIIQMITGPFYYKCISEYEYGESYNAIEKLKDRIITNLGFDSVLMEKNNQHDNHFNIIIPTAHTITLREVLESDAFNCSTSKLTIALGKDEFGKPVTCNLIEMPHLIIFGQKSAGKSCCIHAIINSILFNASPHEVKMILIDPSSEEFQCYNGIPHLIVPVINNTTTACGVLSWVAIEIERRFECLEQFRVRNIDAYNAISNQRCSKPMERIVVIIEGFDTMPITLSINTSLNKIISEGRRVGVHLVITSQQPQLNTATTEMLNNIPGKIFYKAKYTFDKRQYDILARKIEALSSSGDMIYSPPNEINGTLVRGCYISKDEIDQVANHVKRANPYIYDPDILDQISDLSNSFSEQLRVQGIQTGNDSFTNSEGYQYEEYVANWLRNKGYTNVDVTPKSGDFGADIICISPYGRKTAVQCKLQSKPVGYSAIQQVISGKLYYECSESMVVTNNTFTEQAKDGARKLDVQLIERMT